MRKGGSVQTLVGSDILAQREVTQLVTDDVETGRRAQKERKKAGLSLREVARRMGVSAPYVSDLERGRRGWDLQRAIRYVTALRPNVEFTGGQPACLAK